MFSTESRCLDLASRDQGPVFPVAASKRAATQGAATQRTVTQRTRAMSLIEGLVAMLLLASVALFNLQPFAAVLSVVNRGRDSTAAAVLVGSEMDLLHRLPGELDPVMLASGVSSVDKRFYLAEGTGSFVETIPTDLQVLWVMDVKVTQHNLQDFVADGTGLSKLDSPLVGGTSSSFVHIKRIEMTLRSKRQGGSLGAGVNQKFVFFRTP